MGDSQPIPLEFRITEIDGTVEIAAWADERAGVMILSRLSPDRLIIDHVRTFPPYQGQGVGQRVVLAGIEWARANAQKLMPLCPFARQIFDRFPEHADVRTGL